MEQVEEVVTGYCKRAGVPAPKPREDGSYVLSFEGKYEVQLSPVDRNRLLLRSNLSPLKKDADRQDVLRRLLRANLMLAGRKRATLTFDRATGTPFLYDMLTTGEGEFDPRSITAFVNEIAAFRRVLERAH